MPSALLLGKWWTPLTDGMMLVWFALTVPSVIFVAVDIRTTPEEPALKWAFVILALFGGPIAAFFYVLGCREPLHGTHAAYVAARWRQVLGSTMHCAAGDGAGIIAGAALASRLELPWAGDLALEYALGFGFGWAFFQAFAMRGMAGGSYLRALRLTLLPELVSMNVLMAGMEVVMAWAMPRVAGGGDPAQPGFWFVMSMALLAGFVAAYPVNWWLVARGLKHGMFTVGGAPAEDPRHGQAHIETPRGGASTHGRGQRASHAEVAAAVMGSLAVLAAGIALARTLAG